MFKRLSRLIKRYKFKYIGSAGYLPPETIRAFVEAGGYDLTKAHIDNLRIQDAHIQDINMEDIPRILKELHKEDNQ